MKSRWIYRLYNTAVFAASPFLLIGVFLRWRKRILHKGVHHWRERLGHYAPPLLESFREGTWWWVHAVSMGEVKAIAPFLRKVPERFGVRLLLSVVTPDALLWAQDQKLAEVLVAAPIDMPRIVRHAFRQVRPKLFLTVESEFWPNLLREAKRSHAKVGLINGRISERSFQRYRMVRKGMEALWENVDFWAVRQEEDAARFRDLGVPPEKIHVTGNLKYDLPLPDASTASMVRLSEANVLTLGCTREGEEEILLPVILALRSAWPRLRVIWAPRHVERAREVDELLRRHGLASARKSSGSVVLDTIWDTMGDLIAAYAQSDIVIVGGSYVPKGGQNPLEAAALERAILFGPSMENFRGIADTLVKDGGALQVPLEKLQLTLDDLLRKPELRRAYGRQAREVLKRRQGATERTFLLLESLLS